MIFKTIIIFPANQLHPCLNPPLWCQRIKTNCLRWNVFQSDAAEHARCTKIERKKGKMRERRERDRFLERNIQDRCTANRWRSSEIICERRKRNSREQPAPLHQLQRGSAGTKSPSDSLQHMHVSCTLNKCFLLLYSTFCDIFFLSCQLQRESQGQLHTPTLSDNTFSPAPASSSENSNKVMSLFYNQRQRGCKCVCVLQHTHCFQLYLLYFPDPHKAKHGPH